MTVQTKKSTPLLTPETYSSHEEYQLLEKLAAIEERIKEQFREEIELIAQEMKRLGMDENLMQMKGALIEEIPSIEAAKEELKNRLKKRTRKASKVSRVINFFKPHRY